jgi:hypothetical protein
MKNTKPANPNPNAEQDSSNIDVAKWTRAVAIYTLALVILTAILAAAAIVSNIFIYQQFRVASDALKDTREQQRAVIYQDGADILTILNPDETPGVMAISVPIYNVGSTRTAWFRGWISAVYFDGTSPPNNLDLSKPYSQMDLTDTIIPGNGKSRNRNPPYRNRKCKKVL